jgi:hypothetical protein
MRKQRWMAVIGFCICVAAFPVAALGQTPSLPLQNAIAVSSPILAMPGEVAEVRAFEYAVTQQVTGSGGGIVGKRPHSVVVIDASTSATLAQTTISSGLTSVEYTVPMNAMTPNGPGQLIVVAVIADPLPNCPLCPATPPPFAFTAGVTVYTPAAAVANNATAGPTNVRTFAVAMVNPLGPFSPCSE